MRKVSRSSLPPHLNNKAVVDTKDRDALFRKVKDDVQSNFAILTHPLHSGSVAQMEIEDNGPGMDEETKEIGKGTGLGLSLSYFIIVDDHGEEMEVESTGGVCRAYRAGIASGGDSPSLYLLIRSSNI